MAIDVQRTLDFGNVRKAINLPDPSAAQDAATKAYVDAAANSKYNTNIGDGVATSFVVAHNLNTRNVVVEVFRNATPWDTVMVEVQRTSVNSVTILFDTAPTSAQFTVFVRA